MNAPTDPLPEPWVWHNYSKENWGAIHANRFLAWTFNPRQSGINWRVEENGELSPDVWIVRSSTSPIGTDTHEAVFPTRDEATHYISVRAMLGTFELREET